MKADAITQVLKYLNSGEYHVGTDWVRGQCPLAPWTHKAGRDMNPSFAVRIDTQESFANCFSCEFKGTIGSLVDEMALYNRTNPVPGINIKAARELVDQDGLDVVINEIDYDAMFAGYQQGIEPIPEEWLDSFASVMDPGTGPALSYLRHRGFEDPTSVACAFGLRFDTTRKRVCFPIRDDKGALRGLQGRAIYDDIEPRYFFYPHPNKNIDIWYGQEWCDLSHTIVLTEGAFDLLRVASVYDNAMACLGSPNKAKMRYLQDALHIVTIFDAGKGGNNLRHKLTNFCTFQNISVAHVIPEDDAGAASEEEIRYLLSSYVTV